MTIQASNPVLRRNGMADLSLSLSLHLTRTQTHRHNRPIVHGIGPPPGRRAPPFPVLPGRVPAQATKLSLLQRLFVDLRRPWRHH